MQNDLHFATIVEVAELIRTGKLSPVELTEKILKRIETLDDHLQSYATVMGEQAMEDARRAEADIASGNYLGLLHGVPVAVKDLCFTKGVRTMGGTKVLADHVPSYDATVVTRFRSAGAVLLGKLNLTEGAMGGYNPDFRIPRNPWHPLRSPGTSSSGSGVATAAGLCFGSLGSDTGGSIRFPSASCGVVGLKPTWGRVSRHGVLDLAESLDHVGPLARSSADAGIVLQAIAGADINDPTSLPDPVPDMLENIEKGAKGVRIGFDENFAAKDVDSEIAAALVDAVKVFEDLGADIVDVRVPDLDRFVAAWPVLCSAEAVFAHRATYPSRREEYGLYFREWLDIGAKVSGVDYAEANNLRAACTGHLKRIFTQIDALVCPAMPWPPQPITPDEGYGPMPPLGEKRTQRQRFTVPFDYSGTPTLTLPCGMNEEGLPLAMQLAGNYLSEPLLCQLGNAYEQATGWHQMHPDVGAR